MVARVFTFARCLRTGYVLAREGALGLIDPQLLPPSAAAFVRFGRLFERSDAGDRGTRLRATLTRLGPTYVKVGQFLATRPDIVGFGIARDLEELQDRVPPFSREEAIQIVETSLDRPLNEIFTFFSEPVAAASIAQVHKAQIKNTSADEWVAVKIIRPGIRLRFDKDLTAMRFTARLVERWGGREAKRFRAPEVVETIARSIVFEMDMRFEAAGLSELAENTKNDPDFRVPVPLWDYTSGNILTIEWIDGIRLNDLEAINQAGINRSKLAQVVLQSFLRHAIRDGFFHADMHPGNLFVDNNGQLIAVDFGIMGRLTRKDRRYLAEILYGFIARDYRRVAEVHFEAGYVPADQSVDDFTQAIRAVGEPIHNRNANEFSMARVLTLLFDITSLFEMHTRTELVMLQKTMVVVEGVTRTIDPEINIWKTSEPVVSQWLAEEFGPSAYLEKAEKGIKSLAGFLAELPDISQRSLKLFDRIEKLVETGYLPDGERTKEHAQSNQILFKNQTIALWVIAVTLIVIALK